MTQNKVVVIIVGRDRPLADDLQSFIERHHKSIATHRVFVDGRQAHASEFFRFQKSHFQETARLLAPGEFGCLRSHMEAYRIISEAGRPCLIVEDDATPRAFVTLDLLRAALARCEDGDAIHLGVQNGLPTYFPTDEKTLWGIPGGFVIWRTAAYIIGPGAAGRLRVFQSERTHRADDWHVFTQARVLNLKYLDLFDHPVEKNHGMESERLGTELSLRAELKKKCWAMVQRRTRAYFGELKATSLGTIEPAIDW